MVDAGIAAADIAVGPAHSLCSVCVSDPHSEGVKIGALFIQVHCMKTAFYLRLSLVSANLKASSRSSAVEPGRLSEPTMPHTTTAALGSTATKSSPSSPPCAMNATGAAARSTKFIRPNPQAVLPQPYPRPGVGYDWSTLHLCIKTHNFFWHRLIPMLGRMNSSSTG